MLKAHARPVGGPKKGMNKLEGAYSAYLEGLRRAGEVIAWQYEPMSFKLAENTRYVPDFLVITAEGGVEFHETKGFMRDDAAVKLKVVAALYPYFTFRLVRLVRHTWQIEEIPNGECRGKA